MKTIYLDSEFRCHISEDEEDMIVIETDIFDGKCNTYIEGYRYVPTGYTWIREDGIQFMGEMMTPFKDSMLLDAVQSLYEEALVDKDRISSLEEENAMLTECILEISEIVYA